MPALISSIFLCTSGCQKPPTSKALALEAAPALSVEQKSDDTKEKFFEDDSPFLSKVFSFCTDHKTVHIAVNETEKDLYEDRCHCIHWMEANSVSFHDKNNQIRRDTMAADPKYDDPAFCNKVRATLPED